MSWLAKRLPHRVAVLQDVNSAGSRTDERMGVIQDPQPVAGLESVPCLVTFGTRPRPILDNDKEGALVSWDVVFAQPMTLPMKYQLVWVDPSDGRTHILTPAGLCPTDTATSNRCMPTIAGGIFTDYAE